MAGYASTTTVIVFTDLEPGADVGCSVEFHYGDHGSRMIELGTGDQKVGEDGTAEFSLPTHALTQGHQGTARIWVRDGQAGQDAPPLKYASGPDAGQDALIRVHLP